MKVHLIIIGNKLELKKINRIIKQFSDEILFIFCDNTLKQAYRAQIQVVKSVEEDIFGTFLVDCKADGYCMGNKTQAFQNNESSVMTKRISYDNLIELMESEPEVFEKLNTTNEIDTKDNKLEWQILEKANGEYKY